MEVLANTWALAGPYNTESTTYPGMFAHWKDTTLWAKFFKKQDMHK